MTAIPDAPAPLQPTRGALVIGASSGIGAAVARYLAREGYQVALVARRERLLEDLKIRIEAETGRPCARIYPHDVTAYADVPVLFQKVLRDLGRLEVVVYAAGIMPPVELHEYDFAKDRATVEVNVLGAMAWLNQAAILFERQRGGQIVGISSVAGERGRVGNPAYNSSKAALNTYLEALRNRLTRHGVHVLTVKPGFVDTDMLKNAPRTFWVVSPDRVAEDIGWALRRRKQEIFTPARWRWTSESRDDIPSCCGGSPATWTASCWGPEGGFTLPRTAH
ncbi:MAG TPA: SDR family NAD(P)-dependent oxidoreductase [Gemmataceae bacterium]|nr:SDR family NAD(P)-dependent oxidoreductase [Gemmataceae bacterium]